MVTSRQPEEAAVPYPGFRERGDSEVWVDSAEWAAEAPVVPHQEDISRSRFGSLSRRHLCRSQTRPYENPAMPAVALPL